MSRHQPMAALAALIATLAVALPASNASAATPVAWPASPGAYGFFAPGSSSCQALIRQVRFAVAIGNNPLANLYSNAFISSGCGGAAI
jgi:hypothetical protein